MNKIRILIVCSRNSGKYAPFIVEQANALKNIGLVIDFFGVEGKGWRGYLKSRKLLMTKIKNYKPQLIHAHYGLSGLLANLQREVPVVTTYHGSDINDPKVFRFSKLAMMLSKHNIFVSKKNIEKANLNKKVTLLPCGVDLDFFKPMSKKIAREKLGFSLKDKIVLFSGSFNNPVKNASLAQQAVGLLNQTRLVELKNYSREDVCWLMNAVDACIMTSYSEGSPQFIKEAMACNCPIVSVNVGDVSEVMGNIEGCFITEYNPVDIADKLKHALKNDKLPDGRDRLYTLKLDNQYIAEQIQNIYCHLLE